MQLLLDNPLWMIVIGLTVVVHVGFFVAIRKVMRREDCDTEPAQERNLGKH